MRVIARRRVFAAGGIAALVSAPSLVRKLVEQLAPLPDFEPMGDPPGFRRVSGGSISAGGNPFVGLDGASDTSPNLPIADVREDICGSLFGNEPLAGDTVPVASFSDFYCPYCRIQTKELADLEDRMGGGIKMVWHELPLLGDSSILAAKAALAAKRQGAYVRFQERLISTPFRATPGYLEALSESIDVSYPQLMADMDSEEVLQEIRTSTALAEIFGFVGTPALVIGKTVVQGQTSTSTLEDIVNLERTEGWSRVC
ncbi:DsbA family protein [Roseivivax marinus]|nr:DsbA family protein [Roseivivax marinus]